MPNLATATMADSESDQMRHVDLTEIRWLLKSLVLRHQCHYPYRLEWENLHQRRRQKRMGISSIPILSMVCFSASEGKLLVAVMMMIPMITNGVLTTKMTTDRMALDDPKVIALLVH